MNSSNPVTYSGAPTFVNPEKASGTLLKLVSDNVVTDIDLEPQYVRVRHNNSANSYLQIDSVDPSSNAYISTAGTGFLQQKVRRFAVKSHSYFDNTANINPRNGTFIFMTGGTQYTATVGPGFYPSAGSGINALLAALNAAGSGVTFAATQVTGSTYFSLNGTATFYFVGGNGITNGTYSFGIPVGTAATAAALLTIGPVLLYYTRWIDINSTALNQYSKLNNSSMNNSSTLLYRLFLPSQTTTTPGTQLTQTLSDPLRWINFNPSNDSKTVDIHLFDEFNQPLYLSNPSSVNLLLTLVCES